MKRFILKLEKATLEQLLDRLVSSCAITGLMFLVLSIMFILVDSKMLNLNSEIVHVLAIINAFIIWITLNWLELDLLKKIEKIF